VVARWCTGALETLLDQLDSDNVRRGTQFERIVKWFLKLLLAS